jgi:hypothetical protein
VPFKHSTTAVVLFAVCLIIWNVSLAYLPNCWQNLIFSHCSNYDILKFHCSQTTALHSSDLSEYTACTQLLLVETREEQTRHYFVDLRIHCSA